MTIEQATWPIEWHAALPSTMDRAAELAAVGAPSGTVVVADYQSSGRGTRGREWLAPAGTCLMFTIIVRPRVDPPMLETLPARIGVSVAETLQQEFGLRCEIKAPNDLLVHGRKLCGVLCTSRVVGNHVEWVLCGIGLNTFMTQEQAPLPSATSLAMEGIACPPHHVLLDRLLCRLEWLRAM